ncbi:MAG: hypothetical protein KCHDKBKB_01038 [Elusimicrobia bacterium]|nr:hypothetical protein [Elusimicrobiota bacterium]
MKLNINRNIATVAAGLIMTVAFNAFSLAEDALRDGQRNPTLLYEQAGQPKRVSDTSPLPVSGNLTIPTSNPLPITAPAAIPITSTDTFKITAPLPLPVSAVGAFPVTSTTPLNVSVSTPLPVSIGSQTSTITVRIGDQTSAIPVTASTSLPVSIHSQTGPISATIVNQSTPIPVNVMDQIVTTTRELAGNASQTLLTPSIGKRLVVKGSSLILSKSGVVGTLRFQGGLLVTRVNKIEHSGNFISMNMAGSINEPLIVEQTGAGGGDTCFFVVNTIEQ